MTTAAPAANDLRRTMTEQLTAAGTLESPGWIEAFATVPREMFVPEFTIRAASGKLRYRQGDPAWLPAAYQDVSLVTQSDPSSIATSSSTAPTVMARMLEATRAEDGDTILEVGTGTGYNAALLSHRLGSDNVVSIDVDPDLVDAARTRLGEAGYTPTLAAGDGMAGYAPRAPYDRLLATCGVGRVPDTWRTQVRPGGTMVVAVGYGIATLTVHADHSARGSFLPHLTAFMKARETPDTVHTPAAQYAGHLATLTGRSRTIELPTGLDTDVPQLLGSLVHPDVTQISLTNAEQRQVICLSTPEMTSWARITPIGTRGAQLDYDGPRDLWAEREPLLASWVRNGRAGIDHFGLRISPEGGHELRLDCPGSPSWTLRS